MAVLRHAADVHQHHNQPTLIACRYRAAHDSKAQGHVCLCMRLYMWSARLCMGVSQTQVVPELSQVVQEGSARGPVVQCRKLGGAHDAAAAPDQWSAGEAP